MKNPFSKEAMRQKLQRINQIHLLRTYDSLSPASKEKLALQISAIDEAFFLREQQALHQTPKNSGYEPIESYEQNGSTESMRIGQERIREGKCACVVVAGGQGTRLRFSGPKGCFPISQVMKKSLFQLLAENILSLQKRFNTKLELAILTSPLNDEATQSFFREHKFFGLNADQVHFFSQEMWPLLDLSGNLFLETPDQLALGPNGNGGALRYLASCGILEKWKAKGIEDVFFLPIDNPLADPFDAEFAGFHHAHQNEVSIKAIKRAHVEERVGMLVQKKGAIQVVEYSECPQELKDERFSLANISLFCFSIPFIEKVCHLYLPLHAAKKAATSLEAHKENLNAWKFEEFIFDLLPFAKRARIIVYPRQQCFAPLKNFKGEGSIDTVWAALLAADREAYFQVTGVHPPSAAVFELSKDFHYPTEALMKKWKGRPLPLQPYVES